MSVHEWRGWWLSKHEQDSQTLCSASQTPPPTSRRIWLSGPWSECCKEAQARGQRGAGRLPVVHQPCSAQWAQCPVIVPEPPFALTAKLGTQEDGIQGYEVPRQKAKWVVSTFLCFIGLGTSDSSLNLPGSQSPVYKMGIKMANPGGCLKTRTDPYAARDESST